MFSKRATKISFYTIGFGLLSIITLPYILGFFPEAKLHTFISHWNTQLASKGVHIQVKNYDRGWFSSTSRITLSMPLDADFDEEDDDDTKVTLILDNTISHGPLIKTDKGQWILGLGYLKSVPVDIKTTHPKWSFNRLKKTLFNQIESTMLVTPRGRVKFVLNIPDYELKLNDNETIKWDKISSNIIMFDEDRYTSTTTLQSLSIRLSGFFLESDTILFRNHHSLERVSNLDQESDELVITQLTAQKGDSAPINVVNLKINAKASKSDTTHFILKTVIDKMTVNHNTYGPGVVEFSLNHLSPNFMDTLEEVYQMLLVGNLSHVKTLFLTAILTDMPQWLASGPEVVLHQCHLKSEEGTLDVTGNVSLIPQSMENTFSLEDYKKQIMASVNVTIPVQTLETVASFLIQHDLISFMTGDLMSSKQNPKAWLGQFESRGILQKSQNIYRLRASFNKGQVTINGQSNRKFA